jgi:hypothetical protein
MVLRAQEPAVPVVGLVSLAAADVFADDVRAFHKGLGDAGYVEGQNVSIEYQWLDGQKSRRAGANGRPCPLPRGGYRDTRDDGSYDRR